MCMKSIHIMLPDELLEIIDALVEHKLYKNRTDVIIQALRSYEPISRFLYKKQMELFEKLLKSSKNNS